jgi:L-serine dehydratase
MRKKVSIFNEVLGPVMHGPSSSHTAASYFIGRLIRNLLDYEPETVNIAFAEEGSYAEVYSQQGSDLGFATGLMGWPITDERFFDALEQAQDFGLSIAFTVRVLKGDDHPNAIEIRGVSKGGREITVNARSIGGGAVELRRLNGWEVHITGDAYDVIVDAESHVAPKIAKILAHDGKVLMEPSIEERDGAALVTVQRLGPLDETALNEINSEKGLRSVWKTRPTKFPMPGESLFHSEAGLVGYAEKEGHSLGDAALDYEAALLGITREEAIDEMWRRYEIMAKAVEQGLRGEIRGMQLLEPSAQKIYECEERGDLAIGGLHTKAAVRALAAMHVNSSMGVVCAAPTGGAAGTIPGVITTLVEEKSLDKMQTVKALFAAGAIGLVLAMRGTFAAEVAGCQVEIGAAGAMSSAAVVEAAGGSVGQALDAAAISFQNTMGSPCDLVQGIVEIPCHTRNALAASSAFVCADLILGGYNNPVPLDETIDAVMEVGRMLPRELRCTALGGLATTPSALALKRLR